MAFKKNLCDFLGDFYSLNTIFHRISEIFNDSTIYIKPDYNIKTYLFMKKQVKAAGAPYYKNDRVLIPSYSRLSAIFNKRYIQANSLLRLLYQTIGSAFSAGKDTEKNKKKSYRYAFTIVAPHRQFRGDQRGPDFIIDHKTIRPKDLAYIPLVELHSNQEKQLKQIGSDIIYLPKKGRFFSNTQEWFTLFLLNIKRFISGELNEIELTISLLFTYFRWAHILKSYFFNHFITHCDFSISHIPRNVLLKSNGIQTWYFTDATNFGHNFRITNKNWNRHPFWAYMYYDNLVTWNDDLFSFFSQHPESFKNKHIVGCLWASHIKKFDRRDALVKKYFNINDLPNKCLIGVYPSTYTVNSVTSYQEAICFIEHVVGLSEEISGATIIIKEKKDYASHLLFDPMLGKELISLYAQLKNKKNVKLYTEELDSSFLMSLVDIVISFPFTSTTLEAISAGKLAIWHDPLDYYRDTPYDKHCQNVTHGYSELKNTIVDLIKGPIQNNKNFFKNVKQYDPFLDGKAIDRFRDLLINA